MFKDEYFPVVIMKFNSSEKLDRYHSKNFSGLGYDSQIGNRNGIKKDPIELFYRVFGLKEYYLIQTRYYPISVISLPNSITTSKMVFLNA